MGDVFQTYRAVRLRRLFLSAAFFGLVFSCIGGFGNHAGFFRSYLFAYFACLQLSLGCLALLMVYHLTGGTWGDALRGVLTAGTRALPWLALLFLPLAFGLRELYPWAKPDTVASDALLRHKVPYLNIPFFLTRAAVYYAVWISIAYFLRKWARTETGPELRAGAQAKAAALSAPGLILYGVTVHFAAFDWGMSLEPEWHSTMYGFLIISAEAPAVMSLMILCAANFPRAEAMASLLRPKKINDLGNLLLAFVLIWTYIAFMQFLIIWSGNLPDEISWYLHRTSGGWKEIAMLLILFQFAVPFVLLLFRSFKERLRALNRLASALLVLHVVYVYWLIEPAFYPTGLSPHWSDVTTLAALGGFWAWIFLRGLARIDQTHLTESARHA